MALFVPNYMKDFACIGKKCRHNCCIGWEIEIDEDTLAYYDAQTGPLKKRLETAICREDGGAHFILDEEDRCPFLNKEGLCDLILEKGEDALCDICTDHPRFRHFYENCTEVGLGLCCEEAARVILTQKEPFSLVCTEGKVQETEEEQVFFNFRKKVLAMAQNRSLSIEERLCALLGKIALNIDFSGWKNALWYLTRLDPAWERVLCRLDKAEKDRLKDPLWQIPLEQLLCYFLFRHMTDGFYEDRMEETIAFAAYSVMLIAAMAKDLQDLQAVARAYSAEVEYAEENMEAMLYKLQKL